MTASDSTPSGPLKGLRVFDLTRVLAGQTLECVLPDFATPTASVFFLYAAQRFVPVNVRTFVELAIADMRETGVT